MPIQSSSVPNAEYIIFIRDSIHPDTPYLYVPAGTLVKVHFDFDTCLAMDLTNPVLASYDDNFLPDCYRPATAEEVESISPVTRDKLWAVNETLRDRIKARQKYERQMRCELELHEIERLKAACEESSTVWQLLNEFSEQIKDELQNDKISGKEHFREIRSGCHILDL